MSRSKCDKCGARRGLAVYDNGEYCHACHHSTTTKSLTKRLDIQTNKKELEMPRDDFSRIPDEAREWIHKYRLYDERAYFWSDKYKRIVFPQYMGDDRDGMLMVAAWMRSVSEQPKWLFVGDKNVIFKYDYVVPDEDYDQKWRGGPVRDVCLTEDVVSAIKVSSVMDSIALGGTVLKENQHDYIRNNGYTKVYIFLDPDEAGQKGAWQIRKQLALTAECIMIRGNRDPKEYSLDELRELLL